VRIPLAESGDAIEIEILGEKAAFFVLLDGTAHAVDPKEPKIDQALYLILAELAAKAARD